MNPYLRILSQPANTGRFGVAVPLLVYVGGNLVIAGAASTWASLLNREYNLRAALDLRTLTEEIRKASDEPLLENWMSETIPNSAWVPPTTTGDARAKGAYWMARASRVIGGAKGEWLIRNAKLMAAPISAEMYEDVNPKEAKSKISEAKQKILKASSGNPKANGIERVFVALEEIAPDRTINENQSSVESLKSTSPYEITKKGIEKAAEIVDAAGEKSKDALKDAASSALRDILPEWMIGEDGKLQPWIVPTIGVVAVGGILLATQNRKHSDAR